MRTASEEFTTNPTVAHWTDEPPELDERARSYTVLCFDIDDDGAAGRAVADSWTSWCRRHTVPVDVVRVADDAADVWLLDAERAFAQVAAGRVVGWRLAICGEEALVLAAHGAARRALLTESEITAHRTSGRLAAVYCPECGTTTAVSAERTRLQCLGCGQELTRHNHLSRTFGRFLGSRAAHG